MKTAGERLREERERRGLTIEEAARLTKIRPAQIRSLEDNDFGSFPGLIYAKSFLKLYSRFLKVDVSDTLEFFEPAPAQQTGMSYFKQPIAAASLPKKVPLNRLRERRPDGGRQPRAPKTPRSASGALLWVFGILMLIGVLAAVRVSMDLARLDSRAGSPEPAATSPAPPQTEPAPPQQQPGRPPAAADAPSPAAAPQVIATPDAVRPLPAPSPAATPEPVVRAEPAAPSRFAETPAPAAAPEPLRRARPRQVYPPQPEIRRAEPVLPAIPLYRDAGEGL